MVDAFNQRNCCPTAISDFDFDLYIFRGVSSKKLLGGPEIFFFSTMDIGGFGRY